MKFKLTLFFCLIAAVVAGHYAGNYLAALELEYVSWLGYSKTFGFDVAALNLGFMDMSFGLHGEINILQLFLMACAVFAAPKLAAQIKTG